MQILNRQVAISGEILQSCSNVLHWKFETNVPISLQKWGASCAGERLILLISNIYTLYLKESFIVSYSFQPDGMPW